MAETGKVTGKGGFAGCFPHFLSFGGRFAYGASVDVGAAYAVFPGALQTQFRVTQGGGQVFFSAVRSDGDHDAA